MSTQPGASSGSPLWGFVIGWLITPVENYGPEVTDENLRRVAAGVADHRPPDLLT
jgi:hypothetical protein